MSPISLIAGSQHKAYRNQTEHKEDTVDDIFLKIVASCHLE